MRKINYILNSDNTIKEWTEIPFDINQPYIEIDDDEIIHLNIDKISKGKLVKNKTKYNKLKNIQLQISNIECEISSYKRLLSETDYKVIKYMEGVLSDDEYNPLKDERQQWRNSINELEEQLYTLRESLLN